MRPSKPIRVVVEFPRDIELLSRQESDHLRDLFRTELASVLSAKERESLAAFEFENVTKPPRKPGGGGLKSKARKPGKESVKRASAKKASKKR